MDAVFRRVILRCIWRRQHWTAAHGEAAGTNDVTEVRGQCTWRCQNTALHRSAVTV